MNIGLGDAEDRHMTTGLHTVRDIRCAKCKSTLGWKYVSRWRGLRVHPRLALLIARLLHSQDKAYVTSEKYKEGKFILEVSR